VECCIAAPAKPGFHKGGVVIRQNFNIEMNKLGKSFSNIKLDVTQAIFIPGAGAT